MTHTSPHNQSTHLRWQVLGWMVACAVVPLIVMALQGYHCARQAVMSLETTHLRSVLEGRKARITDWFEERKRDLRSVAAMSYLRQHEVKRLLDLLPTGNPSFESIVAYDMSWRRTAAATTSVHDDDDLVPESFRTRLEQTTDVAADPPRLHDSGRIGIHVGVPLVDDGGQKAGFLVASILLSETLYPILEDKSGLRESTKTYIVSPDGRFLSGPRPHIPVLSQGTHLPRHLLTGNVPQAQRYRDCCGNRVLGMASPMPELGWVLVAEVDEAEAFAWLSALRSRAAVAAAFVCVTVLLLGVAGARRVAGPFHELRDVARQVAAGHHEERVPPLGSTEADEVGQAFNAMLDELGDYARKLANAGALAAVGQLSSTVVHEMRNPLSSIKLNLAAVRETLPENSDDRELADIALREATRVEGMLNDLLAYGKPLELSLEAVPLSRLVERTLEHAKTACRNREIETRVTWNVNQRKTVLVDEEQMLRALGNVVDNAVQFSPDNGDVDVSVNAAQDAPHMVEIVVRDSGPGVRERDLGRIFEPFFTTRERGTGLGLANVKKTVDSHEGTVCAANHPGGGAVFTIRLPTARRSSESDTDH